MMRILFFPLALLMTSALMADDSDDASLIAHYRCVEGEGGQLLDQSGHQHHGRIVGAQWEQHGERCSLRFDGSGDYVEFGDDGGLKLTRDFTMLAWVTLDAPAYPDCATNWTIFDKEVTEGPEMHLFPTPCTLGNPSAIQSESDVYDDILAKLAWGNLYFYYGEPLAMEHELPPTRMYPITVTDVRGDCVTGKQRIVTARSGVYGWPGERCLHLVYRYDRRGRRIAHDFPTTIDCAGARTAVALSNRELAILVKLPVQLESTAPVNVIVTGCDELAIELSLHGRGAARISGPDGKTIDLQLDGQQKLTIQPGAAG